MTFRALLLTDVVDSTALSEQLGDAAMARVWAAHDRVARDLLRVHRGREIDKTDGFLLLFDAASDAVAYAVAYHRALGALDPPLRARAGLHVGPVILTENAPADVALGAKPLEVDGLAKPVAARVMSVAVGGQTLLTPDALAALGPTDLRVASHGHWRMKGMADPIELLEVGGPEAPFTPPPDGAKVYRVVRQGELWLPVQQVKHNLPTERDVFVGRRSDLLDLARALDLGVHLVSVLGLGGTGKTRLVTRFAWTWLGDYPGGAWFCDLSEARSVDGICFAVASALDVPLGKDDPVVRLGHAIAGRGKCLVVFDNFEQVARYAAHTLGRWIDRAAEAEFVVTTREVLGLPGEQALVLPPLGADEALALFVARAQAAKRDFVLSEADRPVVGQLVALLDGLPLAIELAAARVRVMPPKSLLARMSERFKLLSSTGGRHTRQATLRATLDWSWDLLTPDEQSALGQLSVFEGGFTLEAAEAVLSLTEAWPLDAVQGLVDKSLVRRVGDERLDLLVSVQEYAAERLGEGRPAAEIRHGAFFAGYGSDEAMDALTVHGGVERRGALAVELDNLVAAVRRAVVRADAESAVGSLRAAWGILELQGPFAVAEDLASSVQALPRQGLQTRAKVSRVLAGALQEEGRLDEARGHFEQTLALARELGDRAIEGNVLLNLGNLHWQQGRMDEARSCYEQSLVVAREVRPDGGLDRRGEGSALGNLGLLHQFQGRMDEACAHFERSLALDREIGNRRGEGNELGRLGNLYRQQGRMEEARAHFDQALAVAREVGDRSNEATNLGNLGSLHWDQGRLDEARAHYVQALALNREVGDRLSEGRLLGNLGTVHLKQGRVDEARANLDEALAVHRELGNRSSEGIALGSLAVLHWAKGRRDEARACFDQALAVAREIGERASEAYQLGNQGHLHLALGRPDEARAYFDQALALAREVGNQALESTMLESLGRVHHEQGRLDAARAHYDQALALARRVGDRRAEGSLLGKLGQLDLDEGRSDDARACLGAGERLLRPLGLPAELGRLLAVRAQLECRDGRVDQARATLAEAEALEPLGLASQDSELGKALAKARAALESP